MPVPPVPVPKDEMLQVPPTPAPWMTMPTAIVPDVAVTVSTFPVTDPVKVNGAAIVPVKV